MNSFPYFEFLSLLGLSTIMFIVAYYIFAHKDYNYVVKSHETPDITPLVEFFLITLLYFLSISTLLTLFITDIDTLHVGLFIIGIMLGSVLVNVNCCYFVHVGLIVLAAVIALGIIFILLIQGDIFDYRWLALLLGIIGSLLVLPLYGRVLTTFSKKTTFIAILVLLTILITFMSIQKLLYPSTFVVLYVAVVLYLLSRYRYMMYWLFIEWATKSRYKIIYEGTKHLNDNDALVFISNHISWIDWIFIQLPVKRRIHYMASKNLYYKWYFHSFYRMNECIPISKKSFRKAFHQGRKLLKKKHVVSMFPEGSMTRTGNLGDFHRGVEFLNGSHNAKIVPVYIDGLWGSRLSRSKEKFCSEKSGFRRVIRIHFGPLLPLDTQAIELKKTIEKMKYAHESK